MNLELATAVWLGYFRKSTKKLNTRYLIEYVNLIQYYYLKNNSLNVGFKNEQFRLINSLKKNEENIKNSFF